MRLFGRVWAQSCGIVPDPRPFSNSVGIFFLFENGGAPCLEEPPPTCESNALARVLRELRDVQVPNRPRVAAELVARLSKDATRRESRWGFGEWVVRVSGFWTIKS